MVLYVDILGMEISELRTVIMAKQQVLGRIYKDHAQESLANYSKSWNVGVGIPETENFLNVLRRLLFDIYGELIAKEVLSQLKSRPLVSTVDHLGIFGHPFFLNSNLIYSLNRDNKYLLCLATAGISLNNSSWPGCFLLSGKSDGDLVRLSLFADRQKTQTVLATKPFGRKEADLLLEKVKNLSFGNLHAELSKVVLDEQVLNSRSFVEQACLASKQLWSMVFPQAPQLIYVPLEALVTEILIKEVGSRPDHLLNRLFFTSAGWDLIEKYFQGSLGAFDLEHKGSFLFWGIDEKGRRVRLSKHAINPNQAVLVADLEQGKIYPTSLVCFMVLLYYGITCLGGFNQVNWLTNIKNKFADLLKEMGEENIAARVVKEVTENFAESNLAFDITDSGLVYKPTALDLFLKDTNDLFNKYHRLAKVVTIGESMDSMLPEIYKVITPAEKRLRQLANISERDVLSAGGLNLKIKAALQ